MSHILETRLKRLEESDARELLRQSLFGIEREGLRVTSSGSLALTPHPVSLGSALTHPRITTDYAEALLEFITSPHNHHDDLFNELDAIHQFSLNNIGDELLWSNSMPGDLPAEEDIPIAWYGSSNSGMLKHIYRRGLAVRYGKTMQCIAGIHFNFSLSEALWPILASEVVQDSQAQQSAMYVAMIRNFMRYSWLLMYLFGASPALPRSFLRGREHRLESLGADTLILPYATSLRMSDLGYQNNVQASLTPCYNDLHTYVESLKSAVSKPWPAYEAMGTQRNGEWIQLNHNILQIENEYYSSIRPKRVAQRGERPLSALAKRGVQYVEVRCLDIDPFSPVGIDKETTHFVTAFMLFCALQDSPFFVEPGYCPKSRNNFSKVVNEGRSPNLMLWKEDREISLQTWGVELLNDIQRCATVLDHAYGGSAFQTAVANQGIKLLEVNATPSARVLDELTSFGGSFNEWATQKSHDHRQFFAQTHLSQVEQTVFEHQTQQSLLDQIQLEQQPGRFEDYLKAYEESLF